MKQRMIHTFFIRGLTAVINLLIAVLLSQYLGPEGKGQQGILITTIALVLLFANIAGGATLVFLTPRYNGMRLLLSAWLWNILSSLLGWVVLVLTGLIAPEYVVVVVLISLINAGANIHANMLTGKEKIATANHTLLLQPMLTIFGCASLFFHAPKPAVEHYLIALFVANLASMLYGLFALQGSIKSDEKEKCSWLHLWKIMLGFGIINQMAHIAQLLSFRISYFFLETHRGEAAVGVFSNGISLTESVWIVANSISMVLYARISNSHDEGYNSRITLSFWKAGMVATLVLLAILLLLPSAFFVWFFGAGFLDVSKAIQSLAPGIFLFTTALIIGHYFSGRGKYYVNALASWAGLGITVVGCFYLIPEYGLEGAGWTASVSYGLTSLIVLLVFMKQSGISVLQLLPNRADIQTMKEALRAFVVANKNKV
jgi:O-antigen/teichoic acid export membrane protein